MPRSPKTAHPLATNSRWTPPCFAGTARFDPSALAVCERSTPSLSRSLSDGGPRVRIHLPPAVSQVRTRPHGFGDLPPASHAPHGDDKRRSRDGENLERDRGFEAASLQQRVTHLWWCDIRSGGHPVQRRC